MSSEMCRRSCGGGSGGGGGNSFDPSNLHLKRELTQIKKAAKALRDPGTTSSWRSPLGSSRSTAVAGDILNYTSKHHYSHHHSNSGDAFNGAPEVASASEITPHPAFRVERNGNPDISGKEKDKKVFLYNWRLQKSESERSKRKGLENGSRNGNCSPTTPEESIDDSLSDVRHGGNDSKSDTYLGDHRYGSMILKCKDTNFMPSIRRNIKKKSKKSNFSSSILQKKQIFSGRIPRRFSEGVPGDSEDTEDYSNSNVEELRRFSVASPLLARLRSRKNWAYKLRNSSRREDSSYSYSTPALSTSSYNRYGVRNPPSTVGSWGGTTQSINDGDDEVDGQLGMTMGRHGCGMSCWSISSRRSTPKLYSPSISDTLRRKKGSTFLCGSSHQRRRRDKRRPGSWVPLLTNGGSSMGTASDDDDDDEVSTNFGELDLEALSRLDGRSCRELVAFAGEEDEEEDSPESIRGLCQKYRPTFFDELIGQNIVIQSLMNSVSRGRIAPVYIFQGPRGTGKTSTARIFAAALNCLSTQEAKPCGGCRECAEFISGGKCKNLREVDGTNKKGIDKLKYLLKTLSLKSVARQSTSTSSSGCKVFVIDECHLLPSKTWLAFLKFLEEPLPHVVFVFITTDLENVPRAIVSRCQKYLFNKIRDSDIVTRLKKLVTGENLEVEPEALELIALNADGSLRDAETMLDQLSLLGKRITTSLVNDLVGVVSDEKLLELLELAISSDTAETVKRARELLDSGVDPIVLMSQLAALIMDIIAGTLPSIDAKPTDASSFVGKSLSEMEVDRLRYALKLLSDAEKQLRVSSERSTWFTATLLQLGSAPSPDHQTHSGSSRRQSSKAPMEEEDSSQKQKGRSKASNRILVGDEVGHSKAAAAQNKLTVSRRCLDTNVLDDVWRRCIEKCHSNTLKQILHTHGTLVSMSEIEGVFVAHVAFRDKEIKTRVERFLSSITNSFENVLRRNVDVRLILLPVGGEEGTETPALDSSTKQTDDNATIGSKEGMPEIPVQRIESIIHEQMLETAWLQAMEKGTPGSSLNRLNKPERNQVLPQQDNEMHQPMTTASFHMDEQLHEELKNLRVGGEKKVKNLKEPSNKKVDHCPISPSFLHDTAGYASNSIGKDSMGYESGSGAYGCSALLCWNNTNTQRGRKVKHGTPVRPSRGGRLSCFGECAKGRTQNKR
ncbi:hypothetical protein DM860_007521 [Cuscuta australis]|uniref:AAA+ ATPase domain-containing protein n=1 Tax=Cuscuta australis TaxID=267555 RepID=A0A328E8C4_9ASTE|nr:hypothetical protein DM860_007521 [Cuscuta australis]